MSQSESPRNKNRETNRETKIQTKRGFVGLSLPAAVAFFVASAGVLGAVSSLVLDRMASERQERLQEQLLENQAAARVGLGGLDQAEEEHKTLARALLNAQVEASGQRASELALYGTVRLKRSESSEGSQTALIDFPDDWVVVDGEQVGLVDIVLDKVVDVGSLHVEPDSAFSQAIPLLAKELKGRSPMERSNSNVLRVRDVEAIWGVGPLVDARYRVVSRVRLKAPMPKSETLSQLRVALGHLAAADVMAAVPRRGSVMVVLGSFLFAAILAWIWAWFRLERPLGRSMEAVRAFVHGESAARADEQGGARLARDLARSFNAVIDRAERLRDQGRGVRDEEIKAMIGALEHLGSGDLHPPRVTVGRSLEPIADALSIACRGLLERMEEIRGFALELANHAGTTGPVLRRIRSASGEQYETIRRLAQGAQESTNELKGLVENLKQALDELSRFGAAQRQVVQNVRGVLASVGRRVREFEENAKRTEALVTKTERLGEALSLLARVTADTPTQTRAVAVVGEGRATLESIVRELRGLRDDLRAAGATLESVAVSVPESPADLEAWVNTNLHGAGMALIRAVEITNGGIKALERSANTLVVASNELHAGGSEIVHLAPRLGALIAALSAGASFEKDLVDRLEGWRKEAKTAEAERRLTSDGEGLVAEVREASEAARARLTRLANATETAIGILRGTAS